MTNKKTTAFQKLSETIKILRDPIKGCPWDIKQTHESLKQYLIEESYELIDAIDNNPSEICNELGDVLLQVMLHSQIAEDENRFDIADVVNKLNDKLIERHPHVFGSTVCKDAEEVSKNWQANKVKSADGSLLSGISKHLPALHKANLIGKRVSQVGFDWTDVKSTLNKVEEEFNEYKNALNDKNNSDSIKEELGDLLFTIAQLARKHGLDAEELLQHGNEKFIKRFRQLENLANKPINVLTSIELEELWQKIKKS
jgi:tetrapyrrole methylase family protein/MazG family protein